MKRGDPVLSPDEIARLKDAFIDWRQNSLLETMDLNAAAR